MDDLRNMTFDDFFEEAIDPESELLGMTAEERAKRLDSAQAVFRNEKRVDGRYNIKPITVSDEILERRKIYERDFIQAHRDLFPYSTGIREFGDDQKNSIRMTQYVMQNGGKLVIGEPRGYAKTARTTNHALLGALQGTVKYGVILAESLEKGGDIFDAIKGELIGNPIIEELYPGIVACFQAIENRPHRAARQTYGGKPTYIKMDGDTIRFPAIPGEPSSGSVIRVRPKDKTRGLNIRVRSGHNKGAIYRPDFVFFDDIQTDEDAENPKTVSKIIRRIKKGIIFGGSHAKRINCVMCCTPIQDGDVSCHFILNEPGWQKVLYPMLKVYPRRMDMWLGEYARRLLDFDKAIMGSQTKAAYHALKYYIENFDEMNLDAEVSWPEAYGWNEEEQTEISALQHALNFYILEGEESFESECQCNVRSRNKDLEDIMAPVKVIMDKQHHQAQYVMPLECTKLSCHIDVNNDILTYTTWASPPSFKPFCIDYGSWPPQPVNRWKKGKIVNTLALHYPTIPELQLRLYLGVIDLVEHIMSIQYMREDGIFWHPNFIGVDVQYEYHEMLRACRDTPHRALMHPCKGYAFDEKNASLEEKKFQNSTMKMPYSFTVPIETGQMVTYMDINNLKTMLHRGFKMRMGLPGSASLFPAPEKYPDFHRMFAEHFNAEQPEKRYNQKEDRDVIVWGNDSLKRDNELFDNSVASICGLFWLGVTEGTTVAPKKFNMQEFINKQMPKNNDEEWD